MTEDIKPIVKSYVINAITSAEGIKDSNLIQKVLTNETIKSLNINIDFLHICLRELISNEEIVKVRINLCSFHNYMVRFYSKGTIIYIVKE